MRFFRAVKILGHGCIVFMAILFLSCDQEGALGELQPEMAQIPEIPDVFILDSDSMVKKQPTGEVLYHSQPFSGYLISYYKNDSVELKVGYLEGKQNGLMAAYYPSGKVMYERTYLAGEKHGIHTGFYESGQKKFEYIFVNGFSEDNHKKWYEDGSLMSSMNYLNGKEFGQQQVWRSDGKLRANYIVRENGRRYGMQGIKRCTKIDGETKTIDPYRGNQR